MSLKVASLSSYLEGFERYTPETGGGGLGNAGYQEDRRHTPSGGYIQATRESDDIEKLGFKLRTQSETRFEPSNVC